MSINPKIIQKLMSSNEHIMRQFLDFIKSEMNSLNTLEGITTEDPVEVAVEVKARKLAYLKLQDVLEPLLNSREEETKFNNKEYVV